MVQPQTYREGKHDAEHDGCEQQNRIRHELRDSHRSHRALARQVEISHQREQYERERHDIQDEDSQRQPRILAQQRDHSDQAAGPKGEEELITTDERHQPAARERPINVVEVRERGQ